MSTLQNINEIRTEIYNQLIKIDSDITSNMSWSDREYGSDPFFQEHPEEFPTSMSENGHIEKIDNLIASYYNEVSKSMERGSIIDAFNLILAIYESITLNKLPNYSKYTPDAWDYNFEHSANHCILKYLNKFSTQLNQTTLSLEEKKILVDIFLKRYILSGYKYQLDYFKSLVLIIIDDKNIANYLFEESIKNLNLK